MKQILLLPFLLIGFVLALVLSGLGLNKDKNKDEYYN